MFGRRRLQRSAQRADAPLERETGLEPATVVDRNSVLLHDALGSFVVAHLVPFELARLAIRDWGCAGPHESRTGLLQPTHEFPQVLFVFRQRPTLGGVYFAETGLLGAVRASRINSIPGQAELLTRQRRWAQRYSARMESQSSSHLLAPPRIKPRRKTPANSSSSISRTRGRSPPSAASGTMRAVERPVVEISAVLVIVITPSSTA